MRVLVVGAASWNTVVDLDRLPTSPGTVFATGAREEVGATGAGKALNLARLGHEVHLHTVLGADAAADRVTAQLRAAGVRLHVDLDAERTEQHINLMTPDGARLSIYRSTAAPRDPVDLGPLVALAESSEVVVLNITDYVRGLVPEMVARRIPFWTDVHDWDGHNPYHGDFLAASTVVLSDERLGDDAGRTCQQLADQGKLVVCTHGARGATAFTKDGVIRVHAHPVAAVVDTNGAGDAFTAGLMHGLHFGWPLRRALSAGAVAGAAAVACQGLASDSLSPQLLDEQTASPGS